MSEADGRQLPPGWALAPIEDLFWPLEDGRTLHQGWSPLCAKTPAPTDEEWGVLKTTAIQAGVFLPQHNKHLPKHLTPRPQNEVKVGDILITCAGPRVRCGVACMVRHTRPRIMMSGKMYRFRVSPDDMDARFLEAFLLTPEATSAIDKMKTGGSDSGLNLTHDRFRPLPVPVAPLNEQRRIMDTVEELTSDLDAGVAALERVQAKLNHYRAAVLKAAMEGALTAEWRAKHRGTEPASALLIRILVERRRRWEEAQLTKFGAAHKEPPRDWKAKYRAPVAPDITGLAPLPEGCCWVSLDQLADISGGVTKGQKFSPRDKTRVVPYLRVANVQRGYLDLSHIKEIRALESDIEALSLRAGDVLFNEGGDRDKLGRGWIWEGKIAECIHQNHVFRARLFLSDVNPKLISWCGNSYGQRWFMRTGKQSVNLASINLTVLRSFPIPLAPAAEQSAIVDAVEDQLSIVEHLESDLNVKLKSAQALRQSILSRAFTGQLVTQDPKDEPAVELLTRIAAAREEVARLVRAEKTNPIALRKRADKKPRTKDSND